MPDICGTPPQHRAYDAAEGARGGENENRAIVARTRPACCQSGPRIARNARGSLACRQCGRAVQVLLDTVRGGVSQPLEYLCAQGERNPMSRPGIQNDVRQCEPQALFSVRDCHACAVKQRLDPPLSSTTRASARGAGGSRWAGFKSYHPVYWR